MINYEVGENNKSRGEGVGEDDKERRRKGSTR